MNKMNILESQVALLERARQRKLKEKRNDNNKSWSNYNAPDSAVFLIGLNEKTEVPTIEKLVLLKTYPGVGCHTMAALDPNFLSKAYIRLAKLGLTPAGLARTNIPKKLVDDGYWHNYSSEDYILTYSDKNTFNCVKWGGWDTDIGSKEHSIPINIIKDNK